MPDLTFSDYQTATDTTAVYPHEYRYAYLALGVCGEAGEIAETVKKYIRDGLDHERVRERVLEEVGDILWYASQLLFEFGHDMGDCAQANLAKLKDRQDRNVLHGDGDHR